jgi:bacteriocin biosynthesis cyclodehydratase domain-containing protein
MPTSALLHFGRFGDAVARLSVAASREPLLLIRPESPPNGATLDTPGGVASPPTRVITATSTTFERARVMLAQASMPEDVPWLPVRLEPAQVSVGPWIEPGSMCLACLRSRRAQHDGSRGRSQIAREALDAAATEDPWPFLPQHARIAAALAAAALRAGDAEARRSLVRYRLHSGEIDRHRVVPLSGCLNCRPEAGRQGAARGSVAR